ncbi:unnamed protein product [Sphenostylis stenocarpa]|uniref:Uncharacterized protein n=1 Tax=Sphenostylis stenocarpa TaxID=92480 RepID=A0AA86VBN5_9FABA|nr:unnamed protein product [Sphenostylis stenocarpa]
MAFSCPVTKYPTLHGFARPSMVWHSSKSSPSYINRVMCTCILIDSIKTWTQCDDDE